MLIAEPHLRYVRQTGHKSAGISCGASPEAADGMLGQGKWERGPVVRGLVNLVGHARAARATSADALASASVRSRSWPVLTCPVTPGATLETAAAPEV